MAFTTGRPGFGVQSMVLAAAGIALTICPGRAHAGKQLQATRDARTQWQAPASVQDLEQRLAPYLEARREGRVRATASAGLQALSQADLFAVARLWKDLSASFRELYLAATDIPSGMLTYPTPGGHCEVLYTLQGTNAVAPADQYGYGTPSWRQRTTGPNGVPDYVDEVAWACDSAWVMEVGRFVFNPPYPFVSSSYPSARYKVVVLEQPYGIYGMTYPGGPATPSGFASHFEVRNNWNGEIWRNVAGNDYEAHPELAIRITCAHEFLHAVQYAMCHEVVGAVYLDDFPYTWIEAAAVLMEDLGHDAVNDYLQYCDAYFSHPEYGVFSPRGDTYGSAIAAMFLYEFCPGGQGIAFIHRIFAGNYLSATPFAVNLQTTAAALGTQWRVLLNSFHTRSFYTGARTRPGWFVKDAALLPRWQYTVSGAAATPAWRAVAPYAMLRAGRYRDPRDGDTMRVCVGVRRPGVSRPDSLWAVSVLLRPRGASGFDTTPVRPIGMNGTDTIVIAPWSAYDTALVIVSNADVALAGEAVVAFNTPLPPAAADIPLLAFPNPIRLIPREDLVVQGNGIRSVGLYTASGTLLCSVAMPRDSTRVTIPLPGAGHQMAPGTYIAVLQLDPDVRREGRVKTLKILAVP